MIVKMDKAISRRLVLYRYKLAACGTYTLLRIYMSKCQSTSDY